MKPQYKTGDVTLALDTFRIYVNEPDVKGYFHYTQDCAVFIHHKNKDDAVYMEKTQEERVIYTVDEIIRALAAAYGKEVR